MLLLVSTIIFIHLRRKMKILHPAKNLGNMMVIHYFMIELVANHCLFYCQDFVLASNCFLYSQSLFVLQRILSILFQPIKLQLNFWQL